MNEPRFKIGDHIYETNGVLINRDTGLLTVVEVAWADPREVWPNEEPYWMVRARKEDGGMVEAAEKYFIPASDIFEEVVETVTRRRYKWFTQ